LRCQECLRREVERALERCDALVTATVAKPAPRLDQVPLITNFSVLQLTAPFSVSQSPVLSLGIGFSAAELPLGMQIAGRPFEEATILRVAHAFHQATSWHTRYPPAQALCAAEASVRALACEPVATPVDHLHSWIAGNGRWAGLDLPDRQLAHVASAAPYVRSMAERIRRRT
jgi:aspartyl-tRNA(Asn)/glutamyl-tRNA(Gln) amidotransferase subunit A